MSKRKADIQVQVPGPPTKRKLKRPSEELRVVQASLNKVIRHAEHLPIILGAVQDLNKLAIHTLNFLKLYLLYHLESGVDPPLVDQAFMLNIAKVIQMDNGPVNNIGRHMATEDTLLLREHLRTFYVNHYKHTMQPEHINLKGLLTSLEYMCIGLVASFKTNLAEHYKDYLIRFLCVFYAEEMPRESIKPKNVIRSLACQTAHRIMVLKFHKLQDLDPVREFVKRLFPNREIKTNVYYDLRIDETIQDYLPCMYYMMRFVEQRGGKMLSLFPLRTEVVPKHITIDTQFLVGLFPLKNAGLGTQREMRKNTAVNGPRLWSAFFKTEMRCFCPSRTMDDDRDRTSNWEFHHMIKTDGISCSIVQHMKESSVEQGASFLRKHFTLPYIERMPDVSGFAGVDVVGIDPNKRDLIFCAQALPNKKVKTFRYTQDQRRRERKSKKFKRRRARLKKACKVQDSNGLEMNLEESELSLSRFNHKTVDFEKFKECLAEKNRFNALATEHYSQTIYRKLRWYSKVNTRRSEDRMLEQFRQTFGGPEDVVVAFGDWSEGNHHMRYHEPTIGTGMRRIFTERGGYKCVLVDEYNTSKRCHNCHGSNENWKVVKNPRPKRENQENYRETVICHGLLRCTTCKTQWNRDLNSALNIQLLAINALNGLARPQFLSRHDPLG